MTFANVPIRSFQLQKVKIRNESPPIKRKVLEEVKSAASELANVVKHTASELQDLKMSIRSISKEDITPEIETPQNPVPSSPVRKQMVKGRVVQCNICELVRPIDPQGRYYHY